MKTINPAIMENMGTARLSTYMPQLSITEKWVRHLITMYLVSITLGNILNKE